MIIALAATIAFQSANMLTAKEAKEGWTLLFDGKSTKGWHNFKASGVKPGWTVQDGVLACTDPSNADDIVTDGKYDWFELTVDFKLTKGGNSGVMFHVADDGEATWHSGPEVQIYDDHGEEGAQKTGFLYELYSSPVNASKPVGEWNHFRIVIAPKKCETYVNGVKYYEYVLGSKEFWAREAKSKFAEFPQFAKLTKGTIAIQGDHGVVSFRNIKLKPIKG